MRKMAGQLMYTQPLIKIHASLHHLRGIAFLNQGCKDKAKLSLIQSLQTDPKCVEVSKTDSRL